jgi:hypothetical protein
VCDALWAGKRCGGDLMRFEKGSKWRECGACAEGVISLWQGGRYFGVAYGGDEKLRVWKTKGAIMSPDEIESAKLTMERERIALERQKSWFTLFGVVGACFTFGWSAFTYLDARKHEAEARKIEASKVYLDRQLKLFEEATSVAARLAIAKPALRKPEDVERFWQLYWGELGLVEKGNVASAMATYGSILDSSAESPAKSPLGQAAIKIAHAARDELAQSWKVEEWKK